MWDAWRAEASAHIWVCLLIPLPGKCRAKRGCTIGMVRLWFHRYGTGLCFRYGTGECKSAKVGKTALHWQRGYGAGMVRGMVRTGHEKVIACLV